MRAGVLPLSKVDVVIAPALEFAEEKLGCWPSYPWSQGQRDDGAAWHKPTAMTDRHISPSA